MNAIYFKQLVAEAADELNCITTYTAKAIATNLKRERYRKAGNLLRAMGLGFFTGELPIPIIQSTKKNNG